LLITGTALVETLLDVSRMLVDQFLKNAGEIGIVEVNGCDRVGSERVTA